MTALALIRPQSRSDREFEQRLSRLERHYVSLWESSPRDLPMSGCSVGRWRKISNARHTLRLIDETALRVEHYPCSEVERDGWRRELRERILTFGQERFEWPSGYGRLLVADEYWSSTVEFVRAAREFAPRISTEDLLQALRNVWIINSVQMLLDLEIRCTTAAFAYSMLYPWTDNFLDSPSIRSEAKLEFNRRLGQRLRGRTVEALDSHQREVFDLIALIEAELPREACPDVYRSLIAIHRGQEASLCQQSGVDAPMRLLEISVRKGGSSLLPDGYLVAPSLSPSEEGFLFGYGVFLQLLDDLQDVSEDIAVGHDTLFTAAARIGPLDALTARLRNFIDLCLNGTDRFSNVEYRDRLDLIRHNCVALLVGAVAEQSELFSRPFRRRLEASWPLSLSRTRHLRRYSLRRFRAASESLRRQRGTDSLTELICSESILSSDGSTREAESAAARSASHSISRS